MKKLFIPILLCISSGAWANAQYKGSATCEFDYDDFDYCSKAVVVKYKAALSKQQPNFDTKYIVVNVGTSKLIRYVALDTKSGVAFPVGDTVVGFKDSHGSLTGKPPIISYSINSPYLCIKGGVEAYRNSYSNVKVCYSIQENEYSEYAKTFDRSSPPESLDD